MFSPIAKTTYIQNNYFGNAMGVTANNLNNSSLFGFGFACPSYPTVTYSMPVIGYPVMGCCGGYSMYNFCAMNRMLDMYTMLDTFNTTTALSKEFFPTLSGLLSKPKTPQQIAQANIKKAERAAKKAAKAAAKQSKEVQKVKSATIKTETKSKTLKEAGYNAEKGALLAKNVANNAVGFTNHCAKHVRVGLDKSGLGNGERGDGYEYADILTRNNNFKEVSTDNLKLSSLPAGCILVYDRGVAGYSSSFGHVEVTLGNGQAVSDGVTNKIRNGARVFVPV